MVETNTNLLISILLFSGVFLGMSAFYSDLFNTYSIDIDTETFSKTTEAQEQINTLEESVRSGERESTSFVDVLATGVLQTLTLLFSIPNIFSSLLNDLYSAFPIPSWVFAMVMGIITVIVFRNVLKGILKVDI